MRLRTWALALVVLQGCSRDPAEQSALVWARGTDSSTLDPAEVEWGEDAKITQNLYEPLVTFKDRSVELEGRLAKSWTFSADGKTLTFELHEGVTFHDGTPFNAEAVVFTFERLINPKNAHRPKIIPYAANFSDIASVVAQGPHRVVFNLKAPNAVILYNLTLFGASIVSPTAVRMQGDRFPQNPVGTGPYKLTRWERDVRMVLDRFDGYWGPRPPIARVIVIPVASPQTAIQKLRKGEVQVVDHPTLADVKTLQDDPATKIESETSMNVCYLIFNFKKFPYSDPNFRLAVSLAIDRKALNTVAYYDLADPAVNVVPPAIWRDTGATPEYEFNLEKAKKALAQVNLESKDVELYHTTFARPYDPEPQRVAELIKDQLAKIGLTVRLSGFDKSAFSGKIREESHPMLLSGWSADIPDIDNFFYALLHSESAGDLNLSFFSDKVFDDAVKRAQSELNPAGRKALYARAWTRYRQELPTIPLVHVKQLVALSKRVDYAMHPIEYRFYKASLKE